MTNVAQQDAAPRLADDLLEGVPAASEFTGFKPRQLYHMVHQRTIPFTRAGAKLIFRKSELLRRFSGDQVAA